jgi:hypothetical protein
MLILGNLYNKDGHLWLIVLSDSKINGYTSIKETNVIDDIFVYQYDIEISDNGIQIQIGDEIITIPNVQPQLNNTSVYFVSCDGQNIKKYNFSNPILVYNVKDDTDMWKKLYLDIKKDTNIHKYVIHLGDQVYMDDAHDELINNKMTNNENIVRRTYYNVYKSNYANKYKEMVLKNAYNVMIGDDHEFIDNYNSIPNNLTPTMLKNVKEMYKIFQEDLYGIKEHMIKHLVFEDFQIIIPDLRKYKKLIKDCRTKYLKMGEEQINEFDNIVKNTKSNIERTYYVSTIPLVGVNTFINFMLIISGNKKNIYEPVQYDEKIHIMNKLFELDKEVVIIGGDYHYAEYYTFVKNGKTIKQIITSPISSDPLTLRKAFYIKFIVWLLVKFFYNRSIDDISINKKWFVVDYNYLKATNKNILLCCYNECNSKSINM